MRSFLNIRFIDFILNFSHFRLSSSIFNNFWRIFIFIVWMVNHIRFNQLIILPEKKIISLLNMDRWLLKRWVISVIEFGFVPRVFFSCSYLIMMYILRFLTNYTHMLVNNFTWIWIAFHFFFGLIFFYNCNNQTVNDF